MENCATLNGLKLRTLKTCNLQLYHLSLTLVSAYFATCRIYLALNFRRTISSPSDREVGQSDNQIN